MIDQQSSKPVVYEFETFSALLQGWLKWLKTKNPRSSVRSLAKKLQLKSHTHLLQLSSGKKQPSERLIATLSEALQLSVEEFSYVCLLVEYQKSESPEQRLSLLTRITTQRQRKYELILQHDAFEMIASWYHLAIFEMTALTDFQDNNQWISDRLGGAIDAATVAAALERLKRLSLLIVNEQGKLVRAVDQTSTTHNIPSSAIRTFHAEMLERARGALDGSPIDQRFFLGRTMAVNSEQLKAASELMMEFRNRFQTLMATKVPDQVYHLSVQFYPLTR